MTTHVAISLLCFFFTSNGVQEKTPPPTPNLQRQLAEAKREMPSQEEINELLAKADEKVSTFEGALKLAKLRLDKVNPEYAKNFMEAASTAHSLIQKTIRDGPSAYQLVLILATLDDLSLDAANASLYILGMHYQDTIEGKPTDPQTLAILGTLTSAGTACNDISELIMHATLRYIHAEERILDSVLSDHK